MKKLIIGALAGLAAGYYIRKMQEEHKFDPVIDRANEFAAKTKKKAKDVADLALNEVEYLKERAESMIHKEKG